MATYEKLTVWQKGMDLVYEVYMLTDLFPDSERFGLVSQMRRAAVSIPSNIAEGSRRKTEKDTQHFLIMSFGSDTELETQIKIARRLGFVSDEHASSAEQVLSEVMRMLNKMVLQ